MEKSTARRGAEEGRNEGVGAAPQRWRWAASSAVWRAQRDLAVERSLRGTPGSSSACASPPKPRPRAAATSKLVSKQTPASAAVLSSMLVCRLSASALPSSLQHAPGLARPASSHERGQHAGLCISLDPSKRRITFGCKRWAVQPLQPEFGRWRVPFRPVSSLCDHRQALGMSGRLKSSNRRLWRSLYRLVGAVGASQGTDTAQVK